MKPRPNAMNINKAVKEAIQRIEKKEPQFRSNVSQAVTSVDYLKMIATIGTTKTLQLRTVS